MAGRWTVRGDRPAGHDTDCVCSVCWTRLETVPLVPTHPAVSGTPAVWCPAHGDTLGDCQVCGPAWTPDGAA